ncbi:MAG TPA: glycolate oxidase subunit GlcF [Hyphomicrobium sp.]|nr:glycolate oxidase subunit GlcF [Hyphomicrobium sp.]
MQTNFTPEQLADPMTAEAEKILRRCVHCGLCTATCPTYLVLGDERDSPRGRIYAIKDMMERGIDAPPEVTSHIDRCLSCFSCMTTCPSGVDYMHLVEIARNHIEKTGTRGFRNRLVRRMLAEIVPYPRRFRWALRVAPLGRPFAGLMKRIGLQPLAAMVEMAPRDVGRQRFIGPGRAEITKGKRTGRVILLAGCAQQVLRPQINDATIRLLGRRGVEVVVSADAGCCGALTGHIGMEEPALEAARRNVDAWSKEIAKEPVDAILINTSGCGTTVKDYGHLLARDPEYAERAKAVSALARDVSEFLTSHDIGAPSRWTSLKVAYHSACSMQHGQRIIREPKALLKKAGFTVLDIAEPHICCGSAGVYNILQPEIAGALLERKSANIKELRPDIVAAGNIGCIAQIARGVPYPVVHTIELMDWAYGGPVPEGLDALAEYATDVPEPAQHRVEDYIRG